MWPFKSSVEKMTAKIYNLLVQLKEEDDKSVRDKLLTTMLKTKGKCAISVVKKAIAERYVHEAQWLIARLGELGDESAVPFLVEIITKYDEYEERDILDKAVQALCRINAESAFPVILEALRSTDWVVRDVATEALLWFRDKSIARDKLKEMLKDDDMFVKEHAAIGLRELEVSQRPGPGIHLEHRDFPLTGGEKDFQELRSTLAALRISDPDEVRVQIKDTAGFWRVPEAHYVEGSRERICDVMRKDFQIHRRNGENKIYYGPCLVNTSDAAVLDIQIGKGYHRIGRWGNDQYCLVIHKMYHSDASIDEIVSQKELEGATRPEPWEKFSEYISVPTDASETEHRNNMRFQFMFSGSAQADRIISSLPGNLRSVLPAPHYEGFAPPGAGSDVEGKYTVWYEGVSLTIREGKDLMNLVIKAGGEIYETFLT